MAKSGGTEFLEIMLLACFLLLAWNSYLNLLYCKHGKTAQSSFKTIDSRGAPNNVALNGNGNNKQPASKKQKQRKAPPAWVSGRGITRPKCPGQGGKI